MGPQPQVAAQPEHRNTRAMTMEYRQLGRCGLQLSVLSFGSWITFGSQVDRGIARECLSLSFEKGVNFFDTAEVYARGEAEQIMGDALRSLGWPRNRYVLSTKYFFGIDNAVNSSRTLNRKYLLGAIDGSLRRLGVDFVDLVLCHRVDPATPIEETVWAMDDIISSNKALYWGTSHWPAHAIREAWQVADRYSLRKPVTEQARYNLLTRRRVEDDYAPLREQLGLGMTTWSPLASGLLTGKYRDGVPAGTRPTVEGYEYLAARLTNPVTNAVVDSLRPIAVDLNCTLAQLAIAWCIRNRGVTSVILGASSPEQLAENVEALEVASRIDGDIAKLIDSRTAEVQEGDDR
jgi:voltage-dependent potassium channel beta subunit